MHATRNLFNWTIALAYVTIERIQGAVTTT